MELKDMNLTQKEKDDLSFAVAVATTGGPEPSEFAKEVFINYKRGEIDYKTAIQKITDHHKKNYEN